MNNLPGLNFQLGEDIDALRDAVRDFAQAEIAPRAAEIDRSDQFPADLWQKMGALGVLGITVSEEYGGANMGYLAHMIAMEEISRASASVGLSYGAHSNLCVNQIKRNGTDEQRAKYFPNPEDTITVGTAGCGRLAISQAAIPFVYGNYGDQNGVASGLSRGLRLRFGDKPKDVVVMAGDGGTADIGFQQVLHSWFRKERFTTIMLDNEVYGNTGGQESGMTNRGAVLKMAPLGKKFEKMDMLQMAKVAGCAYVATVVPNNPRRVESVIKKAVLIAREVGSTYIQAYTSCNIEYAIPTDKVMEDAKNVENDRYQFSEYITDEAKQFLTERYGYKEFLPKPAAPAPGLPKA